ncbi:unnamed protein product [Timema podura]|uniref:Uncharacterized protein n=1 Tax=Timema podura TaxID=61482 RepID=A0ABN7NIL0_TIMPD|nr:unnamed protein product [Timema podura]
MFVYYGVEYFSIGKVGSLLRMAILFESMMNSQVVLLMVLLVSLALIQVAWSAPQNDAPNILSDIINRIQNGKLMLVSSKALLSQQTGLTMTLKGRTNLCIVYWVWLQAGLYRVAFQVRTLDKVASRRENR